MSVSRETSCYLLLVMSVNFVLFKRLVILSLFLQSCLTQAENKFSHKNKVIQKITGNSTGNIDNYEDGWPHLRVSIILQ